MELKDLKSGMIVELRNGVKHIVIKNYQGEGRDILGGLENDGNIEESWVALAQNYNSDLTHTHYDSLDIMSVYKSSEYALNKEEMFLWRREAKKQIVDMTMEEICEALGKKIRIVESK